MNKKGRLIQKLTAFERLGLYKNSFKREQDTYFEYNFDKTVRDYQKAKGLTVDGIMNPGGETITAVNTDLRNKSFMENYNEIKNHYNRLTKARISDTQKHKVAEYLKKV